MKDKTSAEYLEACWRLALALDGNVDALRDVTALSDGELASRPDGDASAVAERERRAVLRVVSGGRTAERTQAGASASAAEWLRERASEPGYPATWTEREFDHVAAWMGDLAQDYAKAAVAGRRLRRR